MSVLIRESLDKERVAVPVKLTAAFPVPSEALARTYRGTRFAEFIDLAPYSVVQRLAVDAAKQWLSHMKLQDYDLLGNETDLRLWGPYRPKSYDATQATGFQKDEEPFPEGKAKMLITGMFLARKQHVVEG